MFKISSLKCFKGGGSGGGGAAGGLDGGREGTSSGIWYRNKGRHCFGGFSMAMFQANHVLEDQCQVVCGQFGSFVGIYDGHGGHQAAHYVRDHLYNNLQAGEVTGASIRRAFRLTEERFRQQVGVMWDNNDKEAAAMAVTGTCCLIGVIHNNTLLVASLGDSRAVLCSKPSDHHRTFTLSHDHNVNNPQVRHQLYNLHHPDSDILQNRNGSYKVKGIIEVSRSIGDLYLKYERYNQRPIPDEFIIRGRRDHFPYLNAEPEIETRNLTSDDMFIIFASDGFWDCLTDEEATRIVLKKPNSRESAKKLVEAAVKNRSLKQSADLRKIAKGQRRQYVDDISVVVLWLDHQQVSRFDHPISVQSPHSIDD